MCGMIAIVGRRGQPVPGRPSPTRSRPCVTAARTTAACTFDGNVGLGFRRLSILDLSAGGHQPMASADGRSPSSSTARSTTTSSCARSSRQLGPLFPFGAPTPRCCSPPTASGAQDCVRRFNGMWAFVIHDRDARPPVRRARPPGREAAVLWRDDGWLLLGLRAAAPSARPGCTGWRPTGNRLFDCGRWHRMDHDDAPSCRACGRCRPGTGSRSCAGPARRTRLLATCARAGGCGRRPRPAAVRRSLGALVTDAVRLRLRSDVPVGFALSGGHRIRRC